MVNLKLDSQLQVTQHEFIRLYNVIDIKQDSALNIFFATTSDNQLHKLSNDGRIIKTVGQFGKRNVEFNLPNRLRVGKTRELYVVIVATTVYMYLILTSILSDHLERRGLEKDSLIFQQM